MSRPKKTTRPSRAASKSAADKASKAAKRDSSKADTGTAKGDARAKAKKPAGGGEKKSTSPKSEAATQKQAERAKAERRRLLRRTARNFLVIVVAGLVVLGITAWRSRDRDPVSVLGDAYETARSQPVACGAEAPPPPERMEFEAPDDMAITEPVRVTLNTSCGPIVIELDPTLAPESVNSFVFLAEQGFFDGTVFYRVVPDQVIEAGDQTAMGDVGPGYRLPDEPPPTDFALERGVVALAPGGGPDRLDSRFLIVLSDEVSLTGINVVGRVIEGFEVLDEIASLPLGVQITGARTRPLETVYIESVTVER